ncbi:uncharacterized protein LAESUDRAFT_282252 [Laetiporus sulphureus 93-53]|uniref:Uncharacterized protein n=1 Tax=Laetiporus sulphureus 93-53 TaxID=1314785 RepID=A0A165DEY4_9APHY|nr:uncharacterized protein LAESUDRAFT_282252 [Laetiporus sulphureus 93-53]KZT04741.1 hypothetical protein LAESUDRAFT_282252 [Laetiporus sulphureus 93-53]
MSVYEGDGEPSRNLIPRTRPCNLLSLHHSNISFPAMIIILLAINMARQGVTAAPISRPTLIANTSPSCQSITDCRTTYDIIYSCLTTVIACVWSAIHPDIMYPVGASWRAGLRRVGFMLAALIIPELYVLQALRQMKAAGQIADKYKDHGWTRTHGFFLLMGGFAQQCKDSTKSLTRLDPEKFHELVSNEEVEFPNISKDEIEDKSKVDVLSKCVVLLQVTWFVMQVISRYLQGLYITQMEVFTAAFTIMTAAMYFSWFYKPYTIASPVILHSKCPNTGRKILGSEADGSNDVIVSRDGEDGPSDEVDSTYVCLSDNGQTLARRAYVTNDRCSNTVRHGADREDSSSSNDVGTDSVIMIWKASIDFLKPVRECVENLIPKPRSRLTRTLRVVLILCFTPLGCVLRAIGYLTGDDTDNFKGGWLVNAGIDTKDNEESDAIYAIAAISILFGIMHCAVWNAQFPDAAAKWIWRGSSIVVIGAPFFVIPLELVTPYLPTSMTIAQHCLCLLYISARGSLLVLALCSLASLPAGAYQAVSWMKFIPHF